MIHRAFLVLALVLSCSSTALAKPLFTSPETLEKEAATVLVGTYLGPTKDGRYQLHAESALRGSLPGRGHLIVEQREGQTPYGLRVEERMVFLIDAQNQLRWVARSRSSEPLETAVLELVGFFDFNAHIVSPRFITLDQMRDFFSTRKLTYRMEGSLHFSEAPHSASKHTLALTLNGVDTLQDFKSSDALPQPEQASIPGWNDGDIVLNFPTLGLKIVGVVEGLDPKTGALQTRFWPVEPTVLSEQDWARYLKDPKPGGLRYRVRVKATDGAEWQLVLGRESNGIGDLHRPGLDPVEITSLTFADANGYRSQFGHSSYNPSQIDVADRRFVITVAEEQHIHIIIGGSNTPPKLPHSSLAGELLQQLQDAPLSCRIEYEGIDDAQPTDCEMTTIGAMTP